MATNWKVPVGADIAKVLGWREVNQANQNLSDEAQANPTEAGAGVDLAAANRRDELVALAVEEFRGAVQAGGRLPLSVTEGAVPPSAEKHVLVKAAWALIQSTPSLTAAYMNEGGGRNSWERAVDKADDYLKWLREGGSAERPTDPTGADYLTAVSDENPAIAGVQWGDVNGTAADYDAGYATTSAGTVTPLPTDDMRTW